MKQALMLASLRWPERYRAHLLATLRHLVDTYVSLGNQPRPPRLYLTWSLLSDIQCEEMTRFRRHHFEMLPGLLRLPAVIVTSNRLKVSASVRCFRAFCIAAHISQVPVLDALLIALSRLRRLDPLTTMERDFGYSSSCLSRICQTTFSEILTRWRWILRGANSQTTREALTLCAEIVATKVADLFATHSPYGATAAGLQARNLFIRRRQGVFAERGARLTTVCSCSSSAGRRCFKSLPTLGTIALMA
jgi:hypothetical protein